MITVRNDDERIAKAVDSGEYIKSCFFKTKIGYSIPTDQSDLEFDADVSVIEIKGKEFCIIVIEITAYGRLTNAFSMIKSEMNKSLSEKTINEFYDFLIDWCKEFYREEKKIIDNTQGVPNHNDGFYCLAHKVFSLVTWELLDRYAKDYTFRDFGSTMFYTMFSPLVAGRDRKSQFLTEEYWNYIRTKSHISEDIMLLDKSENGGLYCLFIWNSILEKYILITFICIEKEFKIIEIPLRLFSSPKFHSYWYFSKLVQDEKKSINRLISEEMLNFNNGYKKGRAYTFGLAWECLNL